MVFGTKAAQAMKPMNILIIAAIAILIFKPSIFGLQSGVTTGGTTTTGGTQDVTLKVEGSCVEDTTVTFNHVDLYTKGTSVAQGARILMFDGDYNAQVANAGSKTYAPGDEYKILSGNLTTTLTAGTDFYPQYQTGKLPCEKGAVTILGELPKTQTQANTIFTYWNNNDAANTEQALGANDEKTVRIRFASSDNTCFGNPYAEKMGGKNVICYTYNSTTYSSLELIGASSANRPKSATAVAGKDTICYQFPVICDNAEYENKLVIKTSGTQPTGDSHNISISLHDVTFDFDADTLDLIVGVEDEAKTRNDIGVADFNTGDSFAYSINVG